MRLALALMKRKTAPGYQWTGKHRLGHNCYPQNIERMVKMLKIEEQNMFLLRHPYLTSAQESGHAKALNKHEKWLDLKKMEKAAKLVVKSTRMEDKLAHLCVTNTWEH